MTEKERYEAAWQARRQRYWICFGGVAVLFVVAAAARLLRVSDNVGVGLGGACVVAILGLYYWFCQFRCPRCGEVFSSQWPPKRRFQESGPPQCKHCGLKLNEIPE